MSVLRLSKHIWQIVNAHLINFTSKFAYLIQKSYIPFFFVDGELFSKWNTYVIL